jgi:hypothetical protein
MVLLGDGGTFKRWDLAGGLQVNGGVLSGGCGTLAHTLSCSFLAPKVSDLLHHRLLL